jgi:hypothetical protein
MVVTVEHPPAATSSLTVREVDLLSEMHALVDVFNRGFNVTIPHERFDWLYTRNPDGRATAWFVVDERSGHIAGCTAVFPRRMQVRGLASPVVAWNCGDFCILPKYRVGGAAIKLRRAARDAVDAGVIPFLYAHPNDRMLQIHLRVGHQPLGRMIRLARPIRVGDNEGLVGRLGTMALRSARLDRVAFGRDAYSVESGSLPEELDELFERCRSTLGTALIRDARYLRWRFLDCPLHSYRFVLARRGSRLTGYLAFSVANNQLFVKDWLGVDARAVRTLFSAAIDEACSAGVSSVSVTLLETHRDVRLIQRLGFFGRPETSTSITYAAESLPWRADVMSADAWYMTVGDRDV